MQNKLNIVMYFCQIPGLQKLFTGQGLMR